MSNKSNNRILILGARGLLGSALTFFLRASEGNVIVHGRGQAEKYRADITNELETETLLSLANPDVIVNLVALTDVDQCEINPCEAYIANVRTVENIAHWIGQASPNCHLIQISTDHVYDGPGIHTEDQVALTNYYAFSKYAGELAAKGVSSTILRTNFFGRTLCPDRQSFTDWIIRSAASENSIEVFDDIRFSPLSMTTLVKMIALVIDRKPRGCFNLGAHGGMSKADFAFAFAEQIGLPTKNVRRTTTDRVSFLKTYRPKDMRMNCLLFQSSLDVELPTLEDEIKLAAGEYREST